MKDSNYWKIKPIRLHFNLDSDRDGVPDWKDCQPFNPFKQDRIIICPKCGEERSYFAKGLCKDCYYKEYRQKPEVKEYQKEYGQRPEYKEYRQRPEVIERYKEQRREYSQRPEVIEHTEEYRQWYYQRPEVIEHTKEYQKEYQRKHQKGYQQREREKEYKRERQREYRQRPEVIERLQRYYQRPEAMERQKEYESMYLLRREIRNLLIHNREHAIKLIEEMKKKEGEEFTNEVLEGVVYDW